jgi:hypothetical protein
VVVRDFIGDVALDELETAKSRMFTRLEGYMKTHGYEQNAGGTKTTHTLNSCVFSYVNAGGNRDNIKVEINYSLRSHVLPTELRAVETLGVFKPVQVRCVAPIEIFAAKINALLTRTAMRDLYDISNLLKFGLFGETEYDTLRKCAVFYAAIAGEQALDAAMLKKLDGITYLRVKTDLMPVLRKDDGFDLEAAKKQVKEFIAGLLVLSSNEKAFLEAFKNADYRPELLFGGDTFERVRNHPMAFWRISRIAAANVKSGRPILSQLDDSIREAAARNAAKSPRDTDRGGQEI